MIKNEVEKYFIDMTTIFITHSMLKAYDTKILYTAFYEDVT